MQLIVKHTTAFKKDFKIAEKRGLKMELLENVIRMLAMGKTLPPDNKDHELSGKWKGHRIDDDVLILTLTRTGTHSDLF